MISIEVRKSDIQSGWHAFIIQNKERTSVGAGLTPDEALGNLILTNPALLGNIKLTLIHETRGTDVTVWDGKESQASIDER